MWGAIQGDILDFVNTIQRETETVLVSVLGEEGDDSMGDDAVWRAKEQAIMDLRRSYSTYATPVDEIFMVEFTKFRRMFQMADCASQVAELLDEEPDVSRHYTALVPVSITPEEFWSRYFFKLEVLLRGGGIVISDDDEEEEISWGGDGDGDLDDSKSSIDGAVGAKGGTSSDGGRTGGGATADPTNIDSATSELRNQNKELQSKLKNALKELTSAKNEIAALRSENTRLEATVAELSLRPVQPKALFDATSRNSALGSGDDDEEEEESDDDAAAAAALVGNTSRDESLAIGSEDYPDVSGDKEQNSSSVHEEEEKGEGEGEGSFDDMVVLEHGEVHTAEAEAEQENGQKQDRESSNTDKSTANVTEITDLSALAGLDDDDEEEDWG